VGNLKGRILEVCVLQNGVPIHFQSSHCYDSVLCIA